MRPCANGSTSKRAQSKNKEVKKTSKAKKALFKAKSTLNDGKNKIKETLQGEVPRESLIDEVCD